MTNKFFFYYSITEVWLIPFLPGTPIAKKIIIYLLQLLKFAKMNMSYLKCSKLFFNQLDNSPVLALHTY